MAKGETTPASNFYVHPLPGFVICRPYKEEKVGGVFVADNQSSKKSTGKVIAVGDEYQILEGDQTMYVASPVKVGDIVVFTNYTEQTWRDNRSGEDLIFLRFHPDPRFNQILGVINE